MFLPDVLRYDRSRPVAYPNGRHPTALGVGLQFASRAGGVGIVVPSLCAGIAVRRPRLEHRPPRSRLRPPHPSTRSLSSTHPT